VSGTCNLRLKPSKVRVLFQCKFTCAASCRPMRSQQDTRHAQKGWGSSERAQTRQQRTRTGNTKTQMHTKQKYQCAGCVVAQQSTPVLHPTTLVTLPHFAPGVACTTLAANRRQLARAKSKDTKSDMMHVL
jgi:hypothetical protein